MARTTRGPTPWALTALWSFGQHSWNFGKKPAAARSALPLARELGDLPGVIVVLNLRAGTHTRLGHLDEALKSYNEARSIVGTLLYNVYRSFDFRQEEAVYDMLADSVAGPLLESTYLETRRGLVLENQGGARAKVNEVVLEEIVPAPLDDGAGFQVDVSWVVGGSVGHWGHIHQRRNRYRADLNIEPLDGTWKITAMNVLSEERTK